MRNIETIREFKTRNFTVRVSAVEDDGIDLSWDDDGQTKAALENGELMAFGVVVNVYLRGIKVGQDSLWNCIYKTPRDFMDHFGLAAKRRTDGCNYGSYSTDMIRKAIAEARKTVSDFQAVKVR